MSKGSITLSPKYGANPSMLVCPLCGERTGEIALMGRINDATRHADKEAPMYSLSNHPCEKCQSLLDEGNKFLLEIEDDSESKKMPERTGRYMVLRPTALPNWEHQIAYCPHSLYEKILSDAQ